MTDAVWMIRMDDPRTHEDNYLYEDPHHRYTGKIFTNYAAATIELYTILGRHTLENDFVDHHFGDNYLKVYIGDHRIMYTIVECTLEMPDL